MNEDPRPLEALELVEMSKPERDAMIALVGRWGVSVIEDWNEPEGARFIGTFKGHEITLFPKFDSHFAMYFTVAHLYGHMVQLTRPNPDSARSMALVYDAATRPTLTPDDVQCIYRHEIEAARIGRRLMEELGPVPEALDRQYSRLFFADFHYLVHFIETGESGMDTFARFLRREPYPWRLIEADTRPLVDLRQHEPKSVDVIVV